MNGENMTQDEIDDLVQSIGKDGQYEEVAFHYLICLNCKKVIESKTLDMHVLLSSDRCSSFKNESHMFVSEEWLVERRANPDIAGWRRTMKIESKPRSKKVLKKVKTTEGDSYRTKKKQH